MSVPVANFLRTSVRKCPKPSLEDLACGAFLAFFAGYLLIHIVLAWPRIWPAIAEGWF